MIKNNITMANLKNYLHCVIFALIISLVCVFLFAVCIKFVEIDSSKIVWVNQIIKLLSVLIACLIMRKKFSLDVRKGILIGFFYAIFSFVIFSFLSNSFCFDLSQIFHLLFCSFIGGLCGIFFKTSIS
jgi:putative membrane protein (TIGR04086 family)